MHAEASQFNIKQGRHPVIDALLGEQEQFVPNDTTLDVCPLFVLFGFVFLLPHKA